MSNVLSMFQRPTPSVFDSGYGDAGFDVASVPLMYFNEDGEWHSSSKVAVVRTDTMQELGVHGHNYKPVAPKELIQAQRDIIMRSDLETGGITERIDTAYNGAATFVRYKLPEHTYTTPDGDTACLTLLGVTSLNSTFSFIMSAGAHQSACFNGQVFVGGAAALFKARHTKNLDIKAASRSITKSLEVFQNEQELWAEMYRTKVTAAQVMFTFAEAAGCLDLVCTIVAECGP